MLKKKFNLKFVPQSNNTLYNVFVIQQNHFLDNPKIIFTFNTTNPEEFPDGLTIDTNGNLWVALFGGNGFIKIDPRNPQTLLDRIGMPSYEVLIYIQFLYFNYYF